jgi:histidyl-tRNA synthetase
MREADRQQAEYVIVIGEDEINRRQVRIKNMVDGSEEVVGFDRIIDYLLSDGDRGEKGKTS